MLCCCYRSAVAIDLIIAIWMLNLDDWEDAEQLLTAWHHLSPVWVFFSTLISVGFFFFVVEQVCHPWIPVIFSPLQFLVIYILPEYPLSHYKLSSKTMEPWSCWLHFSWEVDLWLMPTSFQHASRKFVGGFWGGQEWYSSCAMETYACLRFRCLH